MKPGRILFPTLALACCLPAARAAILLSDDFSDGSRSNQNLPSSGAWYYAHASTGTVLDTNGTRQNLLSNAANTSNNQVWTNFGNTSVAIGQTLNVTFNFDVSGGSNGGISDGSLRIGLFNVTTPVTSDLNGSIANANWNGATGYSAFVDASPSLNTVAISTLRQRENLNDTLWAVAATADLAATVTGDATLYTNSTTRDLTADPLRYLASFSLTRTGESAMQVLLTITDGNGFSHTVSATDTTGIATNFNTFSFFTGANIATDFALDNVVVSLVPEPSVLLTAALAPLLFGLRRRRH